MRPLVFRFSCGYIDVTTGVSFYCRFTSEQLGAAWDKRHHTRASIDAWYVHSGGCLFGNGKEGDDDASYIKEEAKS
jgi:hypothetical protein